VIGSGFGDSQPRDTTVMVGQGSVARGPVPHAARWTDAQVDVVLPPAIRAGTYWLKIYRGTAPAGRAPESLVVRADCGSPAAVGLTPAARDSLTHPLRPGGGAVPGAARPLLPAPGPARYAVTVGVTQIRSYDDCDNLSPGDWVLYFAAKGTDPSGRELKQDKIWPSSRGTSQDVDTGRAVAIGWSADLGELAGDRNLVLVAAGVDCDEDGPRPRWFVEISGLDRGCGGEEDLERSGDHDSLGTLEITLTPAQWTRGGTFEGDTHGGGDCGFHVWYGVTATRR